MASILLTLDINDDYFWACLNDKDFVLRKPSSVDLWVRVKSVKL